jgi:hypothetical protein
VVEIVVGRCSFENCREEKIFKKFLCARKFHAIRVCARDRSLFKFAKKSRILN